MTKLAPKEISLYLYLFHRDLIAHMVIGNRNFHKFIYPSVLYRLLLLELIYSKSVFLMI